MRRDTETRTVVFLPNPRNSSIFVDGRLAGVYGPSFSRMQLAAGPHEFRFVGASDCCFDATWRHVIPPGPGEATIGRTLRPRPARLIVDANVPSDVLVDGRVRGRARTLLEVPRRPGEASRRVEVRATAPGYRQCALHGGRMVEPVDHVLVIDRHDRTAEQTADCVRERVEVGDDQHASSVAGGVEVG